MAFFSQIILKDPSCLHIENMYAAQESLTSATTVKDQNHAVKSWAKNAQSLAEERPFVALQVFKKLCQDIGMPRTKEIMQSGKERTRRLVFAAFNVMKETDEDFFSEHFSLVKNWGTETNRKRPVPNLQKPDQR